jgi:dTDP-glucose 4,6-dehydratase
MNIFGERQHPEKFIPKVISKVLKGEIVTIHANDTKTVSGTRHYIHARNVSNAILFLLTKVPIKVGVAEKFNIMGEKEVSNLQLATDIAKMVGLPLKFEMSDFYSSRPGHDFKYSLDGTKMKNLGWSIPMSFEQSLESTVNWTLKRKDTWLI